MSIWISSKGWSVLSGIIFANGHVERADEQRHSHEIQSRLNLIGVTRWWSKHECLQKSFGKFEDSSSGMFCDVIEVLYCVSTFEKLSVKARFDASDMLDNMIQYQHVLTAITYLRIREITSAFLMYLQTSGLDFINGGSYEKEYSTDSSQFGNGCNQN